MPTPKYVNPPDLGWTPQKTASPYQTRARAVNPGRTPTGAGPRTLRASPPNSIRIRGAGLQAGPRRTAVRLLRRRLTSPSSRFIGLLQRCGAQDLAARPPGRPPTDHALRGRA